MKAVWNGKTLAESDDTIMIEGNHYFPVESVKREFLEESNTHTTCPWKGIASVMLQMEKEFPKLTLK